MRILLEFDAANALMFLSLFLSVYFAIPTQLAQAAPTDSILFVTQIPVPREQNNDAITAQFTGIGAAFGNQRGDPVFSPRGGDLMIRYPDATVSNLTRGAGFGNGGFQGTNAIAVRQPAMHWSGAKAVFSMLVGSPTNSAGSTNASFFWQLYEVTNLAQGQPAVITKVANQPTNYNNISPCYGTDDRIIFTSDRPRDGSPHLYPQHDEYLDGPIVTGLWSLDPAANDLFLLEHTPSGSYTPFVDSFGRLVFTRWDHFVRDRQATQDMLGGTTNGTFNYDDESAGSFYDLTNRFEDYPEPRNFDTNATMALGVNGNAFNQFFPWMINEDGTEEETLNHVGRHELIALMNKSYTNDPNLTNLVAMTGRFGANTNAINNFFEMSEDPVNTGTYLAVDAPDFGTHAAGQIVRLNGAPGVNPEQMVITYLTHRATAGPTNGLSGLFFTNHSGFYRSPQVLKDGSLICSHTTNKAIAVNNGNATNPLSAFDFRIKQLALTNGYYQPASFLTPGSTNPVQYFAGGALIQYTGQLWEIDPVEVTSRPRPARRFTSLKSIEQSVFDQEGVAVADLQRYLLSNHLALIVSRNMTTRDRNDRQQPFNLRVPGGVQTVATNGKIYDIQFFQVFQADQRRGYALTGTQPFPGRRVLPTPMHDVPNLLATNSPVPGATTIAADGSQATLVPARRAVTWNLVDSNSFSVVKERYWLSFAPGEIRTCTSCHGLNTADQINRPAPTNEPMALHDFLKYWKRLEKYSRIASSQSSNGTVSLVVSAPPVATNVVWASPDLQQWDAISTNVTGTNGFFQADDPQGGSTNVRFYRVVVP